MKRFYKSKTFWFNLLALATIVAGGFGYKGFEPDMWVAEFGTAIIILGNLVLRFITKEPIR